MYATRLDAQLLVSMLAMNVPTLIVCVVAGYLILSRGRDASGASIWAALGFGIALVLCFAVPLSHVMLRQWVFEPGQQQSRMWAFTALSGVASVLHAVVYGCLLAAIFAGRPKAEGG